MAVSIKYTNDVTAELTINVAKADYQGNVDKALKSYRQRAEIPGFRKGHAPMGLIQKKFGVGAKIEEINKFVGKALYDYIKENNLRVLGEPMSSETAPEQDLEKGEDFQFVFDLALMPKVNCTLSKEDKLPYNHIEATDDMVSEHIQQMLNSYGTQIEAETVESNDIVKGQLAELENGAIKAEGIQLENSMLLPAYMKNEAQNALFIGASKNSVITFEPYAAYEGNQQELAAFLKIDKGQVESYKGVQFSFEIQSISRHVAAEMNEEFFTKVFGEEGDVKDEETFKVKVREGFREQFDPESDYLFLQDLRKYIVAKAGSVEYPVELLKRWLKISNEKLSAEEIEESLPKQLESLTYQIVKDDLLEAHKVEVSEQDILDFAMIVAKSQFAQYGMSSVPDELLAQYAKSLVEKEDTALNIRMRVLDNKFAAVAKTLVTLEEKTVTPEEFGKLVNPEA